MECVNKVVPTRTNKERYYQFRDEYILKSREWKQNNPEKVKEYEKNTMKKIKR